MTASDLNEWVALFMMDVAADGQGGTREAIPEDLLPDRPANVRQIAASEVASGDQTMASRARYMITIRYDAGVTSAMRVLWRGMYFDIAAVRDLEMQAEWLELECERKEAGTQ